MVISIIITTFALSNERYTYMQKYKVKDIIRMLQADGWYKLKQGATSHRQFKHPTKKGRVTVDGKMSDTLEQFIINSIFKQAGWK